MIRIRRGFAVYHTYKGNLNGCKMEIYLRMKGSTVCMSLVYTNMMSGSVRRI